MPMPRPKPACAVLIMAAMAFATTARADDGAVYSIGGGAIAPMASHPSVRMVSETVTIRLTNAGARVQCSFLFRNEGKARTVTMGFPEEVEGREMGALGTIHGRLQGFRSTVDGKAVRCTYMPGKWTDSPNGNTAVCRSWYVKKIPFAAGQTRTVTDGYTTELGFSLIAGMTDYETDRSFTYILRTGRTWKGPIGKATVIVDTSSIDPDHYALDLFPKGYKAGKGKITWTLANIEPTEDITINLVPRFPVLVGKKIAPYEWTPFDRVHGVTMVGLGALDVNFEEPKRTGGPFTLRHNGHTLTLTPGSRKATLDGHPITLQAAPTGGDVRPYQVPAASVVRALGGTAHFDPKQHRLILNLKPAQVKKT